MSDAFEQSKEIQNAIRMDIDAVVRRDCITRLFEPFLHYKGFHALEAYRVSHWLWELKRKALACYLQNRISEVFAVDIHPAARIGQGNPDRPCDRRCYWRDSRGRRRCFTIA